MGAGANAHTAGVCGARQINSTTFAIRRRRSGASSLAILARLCGKLAGRCRHSTGEQTRALVCSRALSIRAAGICRVRRRSQQLTALTRMRPQASRRGCQRQLLLLLLQRRPQKTATNSGSIRRRARARARQTPRCVIGRDDAQLGRLLGSLLAPVLKTPRRQAALFIFLSLLPVASLQQSRMALSWQAGMLARAACERFGRRCNNCLLPPEARRRADLDRARCQRLKLCNAAASRRRKRRQTRLILYRGSPILFVCN